jgi:hypothetical protein
MEIKTVKKETKTGLALTFMAAAGICALAAWSFYQSAWGHTFWPRHVEVASDVPVFETPSRFGTANHNLQLYVRLSHVDSGAILVTRDEPHQDIPAAGGLWPVYRYDSQTRELDVVDIEVWRRAEGKVTTNGSNFAAPTVLFCNVAEGVFSCRTEIGRPNQSYQTIGKYAVRQLRPLYGDIVGVISADGPERPSTGVLPMVSSIGGGYYGQHYVEFFAFPSMERLGEPIRIPFTSAEGIGSYVWSADQRFLVLPNASGTKMCILHMAPAVDEGL